VMINEILNWYSNHVGFCVVCVLFFVWLCNRLDV
jgi:hypothetical protein